MPQRIMDVVVVLKFPCNGRYSSMMIGIAECLPLGSLQSKHHGHTLVSHILACCRVCNACLRAHLHPPCVHLECDVHMLACTCTCDAVVFLMRTAKPDLMAILSLITTATMFGMKVSKALVFFRTGLL